jgi:tyrosine-specific transport protein
MAQDKKKQSKIWNLILGAALLIAGTSIGAGMLALPIKTAAAGFFPTIAMFIVVWCIMTVTALFMLEVALWNNGDTNLISMATNTIGKWGGRVSWLIYLAFLYSVMSAYTSGGSTIFANFFGMNLQNTHELILATLMFILPFIIFVSLGTKYVDYVNRIFLIGLIIAFLLMLFWVRGDDTIPFNYIGHASKIWYATPIMVMSFGYHLIIPSLKAYLKNDIFQLRMAIIIGGAIPIIIYSVWIYEVLNVVPTWGSGGLVSMLQAKQNPADLLIKHLSIGSPKVSGAVACFSFLALVSSLIGVALGIFDFFSDGLGIKKNFRGSLFLAGLTFTPPVIFTILYPHGFMLALKYSGVFATILLILYPSVMVWFGRYIKQTGDHMSSHYQVWGGKSLILLAIVFGMLVIVFEIL